jgi:hypothetical protein
VLAELDHVREDVMAHLSHHRDAARGLAHDQLVDPPALGDRERPELAHHAAAEDAVHAHAVDVVLDRGCEQVLVDVLAVGAERRRDGDPQAPDLLAGQCLR